MLLFPLSWRLYSFSPSGSLSDSLSYIDKCAKCGHFFLIDSLTTLAERLIKGKKSILPGYNASTPE